MFYWKNYFFIPANLTLCVRFAGMIHRLKMKEIQAAIDRSATVALTGPRQVGKTTLALEVAESHPSVYLDLESRLDIQKVKDIISFQETNNDKLIILDEVQQVPEIFKPIRGIIDRERRKGNKTGLFLFLGSASMELLKQSGESLAGRIAYIELFPINLFEYSDHYPDPMNTLWLRGGFPESLLASEEKDSLMWRRDFIQTYLQRDIPQFGAKIPGETLSRFWTMLAHYQGTVLNAAHLARSIEVSGTTVHRYLDLMVDLLLVRRLQPWTFNIGKRLVRSPKVYLRDSGIVHALLNISDFNSLLGHPVVGGSWEGFVIENILSVAPFGMQSYYYRTQDGTEIDLVLEFSPKEKWAIEIKRNSAPHLSKGFLTGCEDIKARKKYIVYSGKDAFSLGNGVEAISLLQLMALVQKMNNI